MPNERFFFLVLVCHVQISQDVHIDIDDIHISQCRDCIRCTGHSTTIEECYFERIYIRIVCPPIAFVHQYGNAVNLNHSELTLCLCTTTQKMAFHFADIRWRFFPNRKFIPIQIFDFAFPSIGFRFFVSNFQHR